MNERISNFINNKSTSLKHSVFSEKTAGFKNYLKNLSGSNLAKANSAVVDTAKAVQGTSRLNVMQRIRDSKKMRSAVSNAEKAKSSTNFARGATKLVGGTGALAYGGNEANKQYKKYQQDKAQREYYQQYQ